MRLQNLLQSVNSMTTTEKMHGMTVAEIAKRIKREPAEIVMQDGRYGNTKTNLFFDGDNY